MSRKLYLVPLFPNRQRLSMAKANINANALKQQEKQNRTTRAIMPEAGGRVTVTVRSVGRSIASDPWTDEGQT